jgi:HAD superfamily hydrolase (TIGR01509 family)
VSDIRHVVFDLGQVLIRWDPEAPYRRLIPDADERRRFLTEVVTHEWNLEQDRGRSWEDAEAALIAEHPNHADLIRAFRANWSEMVPGAINENVAILDSLIENGTDVTALTNWAADTFTEAEREFSFLSRFRGITVSGRVGVVKPDAAIYRHHADRFVLAPAHTLFIDDNAANVAAARAVGWRAEQYVSTEQLAADLRRYNLAP